MKSFFILLFIAFFVSASLAQTQNLPQADTTSGWQLVFSNPRYAIGDLKYFPEGTVYATAYNGSVLLLMRSFDSGITWDTLPTPVAGAPVFFVTPQIGFAGGSLAAKVVWKTTDGGTSWQSHPKPSIASGNLVFADVDTGMTFGGSEMARTTNSGESWYQIDPPSDADVLDASFPDSKVGYAVGSPITIATHPTWPAAGYCIKTTDGGATWTQIYTGVPGYIQCCKALDENTVIVACQSYYVGRTVDGGKTWDTMQIVPRTSGFFSMSFANKAHGLIVGNDATIGVGTPHGIIYQTIDTGKTWQKQYFPNAPPFYGVQMIDANIAVICAGGNIYRTTNGGNFSSVRQSSLDFHIQIFPNPSTELITIQYQLPMPEAMSFQFYNIQGITIGSIILGIENTGSHQINFDGSTFPNGTYYFILTAGTNQQAGSFTIQK